MKQKRTENRRKKKKRTETERRRREWECVREVDMGIGDQEKRKNRK